MMTDEERRAVWAKYMKDLSRKREKIGDCTKQELLEAVGDVDALLDRSGVSLVAPAALTAALSAKVQTGLSTQQQQALLDAVREGRANRRA
jgi:hypothetical protein